MRLLSLRSSLAAEAATDAWRAELDGNALGSGTDSTVLVVGDADGVLLGDALRVLGSAFSLSEGHLLADFDGAGNVEDSGLELSGEGSVGSLSALAAFGLAGLVECGIGDGRERGQLGHLSLLLEALAHTTTEAGEFCEIAGALKVRDGDIRKGQIEIANWDFATNTAVVALCLSQILGVVLSKTVLQRGLRRSGCDETNEESCNNVVFHFIEWSSLCNLYLLI